MSYAATFVIATPSRARSRRPHRRALRRRPAALPAGQDIYATDVDGTRTVIEAARAAWHEAVHPRLVDGGVWPSRRSSLPRDGSPAGHRAVRRGEGAGGGGLSRLPPAGDVASRFIRPEEFCGPERLGVFALFYDWAREGTVPDDRQREQPPTSSSTSRTSAARSTLRTLEPDEWPTTLQHRRQGIHDDEGGLPGRARRGGVRQADHRLSCDAHDLDVCGSSTLRLSPALQVGLRDGSKLVRLHREAAAEVGFARSTPIGRSAAQLPLVFANRERFAGQRASRTACRGSRACLAWRSGSSDARHPAQRSGVDRGARAGRRQERRAFS